MRGFLGGLVIGLVTVFIAVVALSLLSPNLQRPDVSDGAPQAATGGETGADTATGSGTVGAGADADLAEQAPTAPGAQPGQSDTLGPLDGTDTQPADKPRVGGATSELSEPGTAPQAPDVEVNTDAPPDVRPTALPPSDAPGVPQEDTPPTALADPPQPVVPDVSQTGSGFGSGTGSGTDPVADETSPQIATNTETPPVSGGGGPATSAPGADATPNPSTSPATPPAATPQAGVAPVPQVNQGAPTEPAQPDNTPQPSAPQIAALPQTGAAPVDQGPSIGKRVVPLTERGTPATPAVQADPETDPADEPAAGPWIETNAIAFENPDNRPVMAIVLIDDGKGLGAEALGDFPYPLTFAVDPSTADAADKMARHRAAGFEVVMLVDLPDAANAQDAEVSLSVWLDKLPKVVALLEGTGTGVQGNRELSDQVTAIAAGTGLGLIMQSKGLNTAQKLAAREGVPSAVVFRDFDGAGQSPAVMRRFLDQAAFRAGQQGGVIMLGRLRPDTISALLLWGLQDRASRLALAPVSAVLTRSASGQ